MATKSKIIAIDFDGTIAKTRFPVIVELLPEAKIFIRKWRHMGHKVILWTCREGKYLEEAVQYCKANGIEFDYVNENVPEVIESFGGNPRKLAYDFCIDDKHFLPVLEQFRLVNSKLGGRY